MKRIIFILTFLLSTLSIYSQKSKYCPREASIKNVEFITYVDWTRAGSNCDNINYKCVGFYYGITRTKNRVYDYNTNAYYYYYYIYFYSNSKYNNGDWAYTQLSDVIFTLNGYQVHSEKYILFREQNNVCIMWHTTDPNAKIGFNWSNINIY